MATDALELDNIPDDDALHVPDHALEQALAR